ncbi:SUMO-specific isopeptidase USPL1 isoform X2 [Hemicordylus capensis]|uniref:SUMO-specific isopeptidase USPL1 isoform X2 n=1 Tax=Hemicordylus capensis TaxID=884348 RepID=UPI002304829C|nr:SUMO-specific isopeptidase USPL1 isoform X2 [Hemicordylus capensis]
MMDYQKIGNGLQVAGIGASALHMDSNSAEVTPDGCCPACEKKGLKQALRTYCISFEECVFLCENPQCTYPLGFEPLNNVIIPVDLKGCPYQGIFKKRKVLNSSLVTSPIEPCLKLSRTDNLMHCEQTLKPAPVSKCNGDDLHRTQSGQPASSPVSQPNFSSETESMEQKVDLEMGVRESSPEALGVQTQLLPELCSSVSKIQHQNSKTLPEPLCLQWKNIYSLCWLDCILSALVHLGTLQMIQTGSENLSLIQRLLVKYKLATALVNTCERGEHVSEVPLDVLSRAESHLNEIRNMIFEQIQPLLRCKLGEEESPVFAIPLLLKKDPQAEKLFLHSFSWKFECLQCGYQVTDRCQKILTTFTNIIPEWHPLNAVHIAPCNKCSCTSQRRKMVLEKVSSILMMHFIEGLPHNDLTSYSFHFQEDSYQITAVVQYQEVARHFVTWILNPDGTWFECDDLKGSYCSRHKNFGVPPSEIHIVIWERKTPQVKNDLNLQLNCEGTSSVPLPKAQPGSPVKCVDDKAVNMTPLTCHKEDTLNVNTNETHNIVSNNKSALLWGFENLADDDVVTLTLVSVPLDSDSKPLEDSHVMENNLITETGTLQQDPGEFDVLPAISGRESAKNECPLLKNANALLHQGQPSGTNTTCIMPAISLSNSHHSPETLPAQRAEYKDNLVPVKYSSSLQPENPGKKIGTKSESNVQKAPKMKCAKEMANRNPQFSAASTSNTSSQSPHSNGEKVFVGNWVKGLLGKCHPFMPKGASTLNKRENSKKPITKEIHSNVLSKSANDFYGFQVKHSKQMKTVAERTVDSLRAKLPASSTLPHFTNLSTEKYPIGKSGVTVTQNADSLISLGKQFQPYQSHTENKNFTLVGNVKKSSADQAHQLRLKLLQQLKMKKEKLASLDKLAKTQVRNGSSPKKSKKDQSQLGSQKENESLQSLLKELQHQIDVEDGKSVNSPSTNMSQCSSESYDDILSELLSPATTVASLEFPPEEECRYLEMGDCSPKSPVSSEKPNRVQDTNDHDYCSPVKENAYDGHTDLLANKSPVKKLDFQSPSKQDIFEDLLSNSVLNSIMVDIEDLHHFNENLLSW